MIRYKRSGNTPRPIAVECAERGYPHRDADGDTQFENTHFDSESEAWACVLSNLRSGIELGSVGVREAERVLAERKEDLVQVTLAWDEADRLHQEWIAARAARAHTETEL